MEITDETHFVDDSDGAQWYDSDAHVLYVDPNHDPIGSGAWVFRARGENSEIFRPQNSFAPRVQLSSPEDWEVAFNADGNVSEYEWRIEVGAALEPGRSLGLDHLITDVDQKGDPLLERLAAWGQFTGKSGRAGRLGDVLLVAREARLVTLTGNIDWAEEVQGLIVVA